MNVWYRVDKSERVVVVTGSFNNGRAESTSPVDPKVTGDAHIRRISGFLVTSITGEQGFPLHQC